MAITLSNGKKSIYIPHDSYTFICCGKANRKN